MLQRLLSSDALVGIVDEYPLEKIEKLLVEIRSWLDDILYVCY